MRACEALLRAGEKISPPFIDHPVYQINFFEITHRGFIVGTKYGFCGFSITFSPIK